jgi:carbonic anhydrase
MNATMDQKQRLVDGNSLFKKTVDPVLLARLAKKQEPFVAILTCSDSRVSPIKIFNLSLGDAFVVRVAGNSASDPSVLGSLEYAVEHLHVGLLLVLGHTGCGAVKAVIDGSGNENLRPVMRDIERARAKVPMDQINNQNAIAEGNVRLQLRLIEDNSRIIHDAVSDGKLALCGAMYDLETGLVRFV